MATVIIPTPLRKFTNNEPRVTVQAATVKEAITILSDNFPELRKNLLDDSGTIRGFVNLFVGDDDIRNLQQENTALDPDTVLSIVPAIAGGSGQEDHPFSKEELARYNRHIIIPDFGLEAQKKLKAAKVLVVGSGGLGSPLLLYLAAAGVGTIGIVDFDVVDDSNLQRQVLFGVENIGELKVEAVVNLPLILVYLVYTVLVMFYLIVYLLAYKHIGLIQNNQILEVILLPIHMEYLSIFLH